MIEAKYCRFTAWPPILCCVLALLHGLTGCMSDQQAREDATRLTRIQQLEDQLAAQARRLLEKDEEVRDQAAVIQRLRALPADRRLEDLVHVGRIEIERLSGGYDENRDAVDDGVVVYLRLVDQFGGSIRASGTVRVRLLDLDAPPDRQLLGRVELTAEQLEGLWYGRFLTSHYAVHVPWRPEVAAARPREVTISVTFTDFLSGRTFRAQAAVGVALGSAANSNSP